MADTIEKWLKSDAGKAAVLAAFLMALTLIFMERALLPPSGQALAGHDIRGAYYIWYDTTRQVLQEGRLPLWDTYQYGGFPFLVNPQVGLFYPPAWLPLILPINVGISWYVAFHIWLAAVGMLLFVRFMSGRWLGALLAALAFGFSGYLAGRLWAGHMVPLAVNAWIPWMLLGLAWSARRGDWPTAVMAGLPFGLAILAGHVPSLLYVWMIWGLFALYLVLVTRPWPATTTIVRQALIIGLVGLALSAVQLLPLLQFMAFSTSLSEPSFEAATDYSLPLAHLITLIIPDYFGEPLRVGYWSVPTFEELTYYVGVLPLLGLVLALRRPNRLVWFYVGLIVLGLWLAVGKYSFLYRLFYDFLPPFRVVRAPGRAAILYTFAASALLGEAIAIWQRIPLADRREKLGQVMRWSLAVVLVAGVAALAATGAVFATYHPTDTSGRLWHQIGGWSLALTLFMGGGALLWLYLLTDRIRPYRRWLLAVGLVGLVTADLWFFSFKMVRLEPVAPTAIWQDAGRVIGETRERVLPWGVSLFTQNEATPVGLRTVFGYGGLEMAALEDFAASVPDPRATTYDLLGATHVLAPVPLDNFTGGEGALTLVEQAGAAWVYRRARGLPIVRLVSQVEMIDDRAAAIARVHEPGFDPATTVILDQTPSCYDSLVPDTAASAEIITERAGYWHIQTHSPAPAVLVLSETAYPGWHVTINGHTAVPLTAYTVVKAVCVPAGSHSVEWQFKPSIFGIGGMVSVAALLLVGLAGFRLRMRIK